MDDTEREREQNQERSTTPSSFPRVGSNVFGAMNGHGHGHGVAGDGDDGDGGVSPLEQEVLEEYERLSGNMRRVSFFFLLNASCDSMGWVVSFDTRSSMARGR